MLVNMMVSGFFHSIKPLFIYADTVNWTGLSISVVFSMIIGAFVAINGVAVWENYQVRKKCVEGNALTGIGAVGGLMTGICPICIAGLFPLLFNLVGISFSFALLPLQGLEIQAGIIILLIVGNIVLRKKI